ncbi:hypothetical protein GCM10022631_14390 [Deinococcus rubellus]
MQQAQETGEILNSDSYFLFSGMHGDVMGVQEDIQVTLERKRGRMDGKGGHWRGRGREDGVAGAKVGQDELLVTPLNPSRLVGRD